MQQIPVLITTTIGAAVVACLGAILLAPDTDGSSTLLAFGLALLGAVTLVGFLVTHGIWARRAVAGTLIAGIVSLAATESSAWWWTALGLSAVALYLVLGPPLDRWTRRLPPPTPLPYQVIALPLALLAVPYVAGLASVDLGPGTVWAVVAVVTAWAFSRALSIGLWSARILVPLAGLFAAFTPEQLWQTVLTLTVVASAAWLAWSKPALLVVSPLETVRGEAKPVFAAFAPDEVRRAAGVDRDGRRL